MGEGTKLQRFLAHVQRLSSLATAEAILGASCEEVLALTGGARAFASCTLPRMPWEQGTHVERDAAGTRPATPAGRSAMFAIHRRLAGGAARVTLSRTAETQAIFAGLGCDPGILRLSAEPIIHRSGRVWGALVLIDVDAVEGVAEVAQLATSALENAQRLAFARRDQERLLLLAEATDDALYDWNLDTRVFWWGGGILKLHGGDAEPTATWKAARIHPDDLPRVRASFEEARTSHAMRWEGQYRFRRADGDYCDVEDRLYFLRDAAGRACRTIGAMRDVSAINALLLREQEARADAERANRAKDDFLAMLGHELRNPLAPIVSGLELLRTRGLVDPARDLQVLHRQADHLIRLVDDLLDISRIAHGKIALDLVRVEIGDVVAEAVETAMPLIQTRRHTLVVDVPPGGLVVCADRARLAQALANLLTNAAKYTEPGGAIVVTARRDGDDIAIVVRDNGIGIPADMLPRIFTMFVQEGQKLDRSLGGLGLGLSIVRNLIELHGGRVEATSQGRGLGSELTMRIPGAPAEARATTAPAAAASSGEVARLRILVVDDNEDAADLLAELLEELGHATRVAHDAERALRLVDEEMPDLAVLDIGLPSIDGYELARRLRARAGVQPHLIALTGYGQAGDKERAVDAGFDAHLVKPVSIATLQALIARL